MGSEANEIREFKPMNQSMGGYADQNIQRKRDMKATMRDVSPSKIRFNDQNFAMQNQYIDKSEKQVSYLDVHYAVFF